MGATLARYGDAMTGDHERHTGAIDHRIDLFLLASLQAGYVTPRQARLTGMSDSEIADAVSAGSIERVHRDLLRMVPWPAGAFDEYAKWCAWFGCPTAVSHHSAAELHGLGSLHPHYLHLSCPGSARPRIPRLAVHRLTLPDDDIEVVGPFRITTPLRTVLDLADSGVSQAVLNEVVADAVAIERIAPVDVLEKSTSRSSHTVERVERALVACGRSH